MNPNEFYLWSPGWQLAGQPVDIATCRAMLYDHQSTINGKPISSLATANEKDILRRQIKRWLGK